MAAAATDMPTPAHDSSAAAADPQAESFLDIMSQFPVLNAYSQLVFGFDLPEDTSRDAIVSSIQTGLDEVVERVPWLGWHIVKHQDSGIYGAVPWPSDYPRERVRVRDCTSTIRPLVDIVRAGAPMSMLPGSELCPWPALPFPHGLDVAPVFAVQLNFVRGGLILNLNVHHIIMDGGGALQLISMLVHRLHGREIPAADLEQANRDRSRVVPLIPRGEPLKDHSHLRAPPGYTFTPPDSLCRWCYFKMPASALPRLVRTAHDPARLVSDNDVQCDFYWQRLTTVREARGLSSEAIIKFGRALDGRSALGVPMTYMGHIVTHGLTRLPAGRVTSMSLAELAQVLRKDLAAANQPWAIRSYATFIAREPDRARLLYSGPHNSNTDAVASSIGQAAAPQGAWSELLGTCKFFRRPNVAPIPGSLVVTPAEGGAIPVLVCLPEADLQGLTNDPLWKQYMRHVD